MTCDLVTLRVNQTKHLQAINPRIIELIIFTNFLGGFTEFIRVGFQFSHLIFQCIKGIGDCQVPAFHRLQVLPVERGVLPDHSAAHQFDPRILADGTLHVVAVPVEVEGDVLSLTNDLALSTSIPYRPVPHLGLSNGLRGFLVGRSKACILTGGSQFQQLLGRTHFTHKRAQIWGNIFPEIELRIGFHLTRYTNGARSKEPLCLHGPKDFLGDGFRDTLGHVFRGIGVRIETPELGDVLGQTPDSLRQAHTGIELIDLGVGDVVHLQASELCHVFLVEVGLPVLRSAEPMKGGQHGSLKQGRVVPDTLTGLLHDGQGTATINARQITPFQ